MESYDPDDPRSILNKLKLPDFQPWNIDSRNNSLCIIRDDEIEQIQSRLQLIHSGDATEEQGGKWSRRQIYTMLIFIFANIFNGNIVSIQSPFYPKEAEEKGVTPTEFGFVFGIFYLTMMICSPIHGTLLGRINPKLMFCAAIFTTGMSTISFGFLEFVYDRTTFIVLSFVIRAIQACGHSANIASSFTIIAVEFPESVATTFAALETCFGLGLIIGPSVGGVLYQLGGFVLPFLIMGSLVLITAIFAYFLLANLPVGGVEESSGGFFSLMKIPAVALAAFSMAVSSSSIGFLTATLEPHLREKFNLTPIYTGLMFIIDGSMYALSAPVWGRFCSFWFSEPKYVTLIGCCLTFTGFLFIGPAPFMPFDSILWVTIMGLAIHGLGMGASFVSAFLQGMQDAVANGFPDSVGTYGLVSGMWVTFLAVGSFIGPSLGGILLDNFGFRLGCLFVLGTNTVMGLTTIIFICHSNKRISGNSLDENERLLSSKNISISDEQSSPDNSITKSETKIPNYGST